MSVCENHICREGVVIFDDVGEVGHGLAALVARNGKAIRRGRIVEEIAIRRPAVSFVKSAGVHGLSAQVRQT